MNAGANTEVDLGPAEEILNRVRGTAAHLIPILQEIQSAYGYLPSPVLSWLSNRTGIPSSRIYGVVTFYAQFHLEPQGKHTVRCCRGTACHVKGGKRVLGAVKKTLNTDEGEMTDDMLFSLETVACLGACALAPVVVVDNTYYGKMTAGHAEQILESIQREEG